MRAFYFILVIWLAACAESSVRSADPDNSVNKSGGTDSIISNLEIDRDNHWVPYQPKYLFNTFPTNIHTGKLVGPDFSTVDYGNDKGFQQFLREGLEGVPINFAGKFSIVEKSCGAMCVAFYMVDRTNGKIFSFPLEGDGHWGYKYQPDSELLVGNSELLNERMDMYLDKWAVEPEFYHWTGKKFNPLK